MYVYEIDCIIAYIFVEKKTLASISTTKKNALSCKINLKIFMYTPSANVIVVELVYQN